MKVRELMTARVVAVSPDATIVQAAARMRDEQVGSVLVVHNDKLVGMVTDRQITHTTVAAGDDPSIVRVRDIMFEDFIPLDPEMDVLKAMQLQRELGMRRLPVVENGRPIGIVSVSDIAMFVKEFIDCVLQEGSIRVTRRERE